MLLRLGRQCQQRGAAARRRYTRQPKPR
jgi:hypothetical protein